MLVVSARLYRIALTCLVFVIASTSWTTTRPVHNPAVSLPSYRWMEPPTERAGDNQPPAPETFRVVLKEDGTTDPASVSTSDGQAGLTFDLISPLEGLAFVVTFTPLEASQVAAAAGGTYFDSNAYRINAAYENTQKPVRGSFTIMTRFSVHADRMMWLNNGSWQPLFQPVISPIDLRVQARTPVLGTFVASGSGTRPLTGSEHIDRPSPRPSSETYRWLQPPDGEATGNKVPQKETFTVRIDSFGQTELTSVSTADGQATAYFNYVPESGQSKLQIELQPKDPASLAPAPTGLAFQGNAYRIQAHFPNGSLAPGFPNKVTLHYFDRARHLLVLDGNRWVKMATPNLSRTGNLITARTTGAGTYVAASNREEVAPALPNESSSQAWLFGAGALLVLLVLAVRKRKRKSKP